MAQKPSISLFKYYKLGSEKEALSFERKLHNDFKEYRVRGEWFNLTDVALTRLLRMVNWKTATAQIP